MLRETWRLQRDFFYDPKMHGVDWDGVWKQYGSLADRMASRDDLEDLIGEILGELSVGHAYHFPGDVRRGKPVGTGLLAADLDYDGASGFWKIGRIYSGDYPDMKTASPLSRADLNVHSGMWLVAIDGRPLVKGEDYMRRLANRAGQETELSINDAPKLEGARRIVVKPIANDTRIRYATWVRDTRAAVDKASNGQIGYLHLYDMQGFGLQQFSRDYPPQWNKRGFIIDDRWNHGGFVATMIVAHLDRKVFSIAGTRYGKTLVTTPDRAFHGYMDVLINRQGGSDCRNPRAVVQGLRPGPDDRDAHLGWLGRHPRRQAVPRRRRHHAAGVRRLGPARPRLADRGSRRRPGCRPRPQPGRVPGRQGRAARLRREGPAREDRQGPEGSVAGAADYPAAAQADALTVAGGRAGCARPSPAPSCGRMRIPTSCASCRASARGDP